MSGKHVKQIYITLHICVSILVSPQLAQFAVQHSAFLQPPLPVPCLWAAYSTCPQSSHKLSLCYLDVASCHVGSLCPDLLRCTQNCATKRATTERQRQCECQGQVVIGGRWRWVEYCHMAVGVWRLCECGWSAVLVPIG